MYGNSPSPPSCRKGPAVHRRARRRGAGSVLSSSDTSLTFLNLCSGFMCFLLFSAIIEFFKKIPSGRIGGIMRELYEEYYGSEYEWLIHLKIIFEDGSEYIYEDNYLCIG